MTHTRFLAALVGLALFVAPHSLAAQERSASASAAIQAATDVQAWFGELEQLHGRLQDLQEKALKDPQLTHAQVELGTLIKQAMERTNPSLAKNIVRMQAMEVEAAAAHQKGDSGKLQQLGAEAQQIERQFAATQQKVLQQPEIAARVASFQQTLERKMVALNPETEKLIARFRELEAKLAASAQGGGSAK